MKAVIPVAGLGTRMLPATKAIPKEMLPVLNKPLIQHIVEELVSSGVKEIVLVTHASKNSIEDHFDTSFELEATLEARVKRQLLDEIKSICPSGISIVSVRQRLAKGLGHAVLAAYPVVGDSDVVVVLPDVLISPYSTDLADTNLSEMLRQYRVDGRSKILVQEVPKEQVDKFGIAVTSSPSGGNIERLVEKPSVESAPGRLAIVGRYVLSKEIWKALKITPLGASDEIQLTDGIAIMLSSGLKADAVLLSGRTFDCGSLDGWLMANVHYAMYDGKLSPASKQEIAEELNRFFVV